jgi:hypothetical protein
VTLRLLLRQLGVSADLVRLSQVSGDVVGSSYVAEPKSVVHDAMVGAAAAGGSGAGAVQGEHLR